MLYFIARLVITDYGQESEDPETLKKLESLRRHLTLISNLPFLPGHYLSCYPHPPSSAAPWHPK